jgi:hypothetical protein
MLEKVIDATGKGSIVAIPASEAATKMGVFMDVGTFQLISACGVAVLIVDRGVRLYWADKDRRRERIEREKMERPNNTESLINGKNHE